MKTISILAILPLATSSFLPLDHPRVRATKYTPSRSPCPALNVLANEGILPNSGQNITAPMFITALTSTYNIDRSFAEQLATNALSTVGSSKDATAINLSDLNKHDIIEHDASLTRLDAKQGDNHSVQRALLDALIADAGPNATYITVESLAKTRSRRETESKAAGSPGLGAKANTLAYGETALLLQALSHLQGSGQKPGNWAAPVEAVRVWMGDERLPKGYKAPQSPISFASTGVLATQVTGLRAAFGVTSSLGGLLGLKLRVADGHRFH